MEPTQNEYGATGIYFAGPMRGIPEWNFPAFHRVHEEWFADDDPSCLTCGRDNRNGTHEALEITGHLSHEFNPRPPTVFFCPACHDESKGFDAKGMAGTESLSTLGFSLRDALGADLSWIAEHADVVIVLPGWENSLGARAEVALAHALDLIVMAYDDQADGFGDEAPIPFIPAYLTERVGRAETEIPVEDLHADFGVPPLTLVRGDDVTDGEVRVTSSTGGQKGTKLARFDLIPAGPLWLLAELYGKGALKYEDRNWERGYPWSLSYGAAGRHMTSFWMGEDYDNHKEDCPEGCVQHTELPHPICAVFHMFGLTQFLEHNRDFDDRPKFGDRS